MMGRYSIVIIIFLFASCGRSKTCYRTLTCTRPVFRVVFEGYDTSEIDSIVYSVYTADTSLTTLLHQQVLSAVDSVYGYDPGLTWYKYGSDSILIRKGYNYTIFIPKAGQTISISNVTDVDTTEIVDCSYPANDCDGTSTLTIKGCSSTYSSGMHGYGLIRLQK